MLKINILLLIIIFTLLYLLNCNNKEDYNNDTCKLNIITSFYVPKHKERTLELRKSLQNNINHEHVENIYLFLDKNEDKKYIDENINDPKNKIIIYRIGKQPTYSELFKCANKCENKSCMVTNSDIWLYPFTDTSKKLIDLLNNNKNLVYILARHEHDLISSEVNKGIAFDSFIIKNNINQNILKNLNFFQNRLGSEHVVKGHLLKGKYKLYSPSKDLKIIHEHKSEVRTYIQEHITDYKNEFGQFILESNYNQVKNSLKETFKNKDNIIRFINKPIKQIDGNDLLNIYTEHFSNNFKILKITDWYQRLGNNIMSLYHGIHFAIENNYDAIIFPENKMFTQKHINLKNIKCNDIENYKNCDLKSGADMFYYNINDKCFNIDDKIILDYLRSIFNIKYTDIKKGNDNDLYIHIRSGDIIDNNGNETYNAPPYRSLPFSYYDTIIKNNNFDKIHIICEDDRHPVINKLLNKYNNIEFKLRSLDEDIKLIMGAINIAYGWGTFIPTLLYFNEGLKNIYIPKYYKNYGHEYNKECWTRVNRCKNTHIIPINPNYIRLYDENPNRLMDKNNIINN